MPSATFGCLPCREGGEKVRYCALGDNEALADVDVQDRVGAGIAYFIRALSEPQVAAAMAEGVPRLIAFFADQLDTARGAGDLAPGVDVQQDAILLWSTVDSQATAVVLGQRTPDEAVATVDYYLDRLFSQPRSATS